MPPYATNVIGNENSVTVAPQSNTSGTDADNTAPHCNSSIGAPPPLLRASGAEERFRSMNVLQVIQLMESDADGQLAGAFLRRISRESTIRNGLYENTATLQPHDGLEQILLKLGPFIEDLTVDYSGCSVEQIRTIANLVSAHCQGLKHYRLGLYNKTPRHATSAYNIPKLDKCESIEVRESHEVDALNASSFLFNNDRLLSRLIVSAPRLTDIGLYDLTVHGWFLSTLTKKVHKLKMINLYKLIGLKTIPFGLRHIKSTTASLSVEKLILELPEFTNEDINSVSLSARKLHLKIADINANQMNKLLQDIIYTNKVQELRLNGGSKHLAIDEKTSKMFQHYTKLRSLYLDQSLLNNSNTFKSIGGAPNLKRLVCEHWTKIDPEQFVINATVLFRVNPLVRTIEMQFDRETRPDALEVLLRMAQARAAETAQFNAVQDHRSIVLERFNSFNSRRSRVRNNIPSRDNIVRTQVGVDLERDDIVVAGAVIGAEHRINVDVQEHTQAESAVNIYHVASDAFNMDLDHPLNSSVSTDSGLSVEYQLSPEEHMVAMNSDLNPNAEPYWPQNSYFHSYYP